MGGSVRVRYCGGRRGWVSQGQVLWGETWVGSVRGRCCGRETWVGSVRVMCCGRETWVGSVRVRYCGARGGWVCQGGSGVLQHAESSLPGTLGPTYQPEASCSASRSAILYRQCIGAKSNEELREFLQRAHVCLLVSGVETVIHEHEHAIKLSKFYHFDLFPNLRKIEGSETQIGLPIIPPQLQKH